MVLSDNWFTALSENEDGTYTFISGRTNIDEFVNSHKLRERLEIIWNYKADDKGLTADDAEAQLMEEVGDKLRAAMEKDKLAIVTGVYTGQGKRETNFICRNIEAFGNRLNETLAMEKETVERQRDELEAERDRFIEAQIAQGEKDSETGADALDGNEQVFKQESQFMSVAGVPHGESLQLRPVGRGHRRRDVPLARATI